MTATVFHALKALVIYAGKRIVGVERVSCLVGRRSFASRFTSLAFVAKPPFRNEARVFSRAMRSRYSPAFVILGPVLERELRGSLQTAVRAAT